MTRARRRTLTAIAWLALVGCGPALDDSEEIASDSTAPTAADSGASTRGDGTTSSSTSAGPTDDEGFGTAYEDDGGSDDGCTFTCPPPAGPGGGGFGCDLVGQNCPRGEKCMPWANDGGRYWNSTRCAPLADEAGAPGEPCQVEGSFVSGVDDCELGAMCLPDDFSPRDGEGTCVSLCPALCAGAGEACMQLPVGIAVCTRPCDPLALDACEGGWICAASAPLDGSSAFVCQPVHTAGVFVQGIELSPCDFPDQCLPGEHCAPAEDAPGCDGSLGCCVPLCDLENPKAECSAVSGHACLSVGAVPGTIWEDLGMCVLQLGTVPG